MECWRVLINFSNNRANPPYYNKSLNTVDEKSNLKDSMVYYVSSLKFKVLLLFD